MASHSVRACSSTRTTSSRSSPTDAAIPVTSASIWVTCSTGIPMRWQGAPHIGPDVDLDRGSSRGCITHCCFNARARHLFPRWRRKNPRVPTPGGSRPMLATQAGRSSRTSDRQPILNLPADRAVFRMRRAQKIGPAQEATQFPAAVSTPRPAVRPDSPRHDQGKRAPAPSNRARAPLPRCPPWCRSRW